MKLLRGYLALLLVCAGMLLSDLVLRLLLRPWIALRPASKDRVLSGFLHSMASLVTRIPEIVAGARFPTPHPPIPFEPGALIVMNHQSVFDIPLVVKSVPAGYPRIVTRRRYTRWIPLISQLTRVYQYPTVDPAANPSDARKMLKELRIAARESTAPLAIFPEGTRTKDGEIAPFRTTGMGLILRARPWKVHVFVADGMWEFAKLKHLMRWGMSEIDGRIEYLGCFDWDDPRGDSEAFVADLHQRMTERLQEMRGVPVG